MGGNLGNILVLIGGYRSYLGWRAPTQSCKGLGVLQFRGQFTSIFFVWYWGLNVQPSP
jgi:hypothetical protein